VHLSLSEGASRLPAETEAELLRIAQEAVTNCRRHAGAQNIWVTLEVSPPSAVLRVEDDGRGLGRSRTDSYGLAIMRERARRLRTSLRVESREPQGTLVEVRLSDRTKRTRLATMPAASPEELEPVRRSGGGRS
jgi:signal transduction histidine kinase